MENLKSFRVGRGSFSVTVYPFKHNSGGTYWRFNKLAGDQGKVTRSKRARAKEAAESYLTTMRSGEKSVEDLPESKIEVLSRIMETLPEVADLEAFLAWRKKVAQSPPVSELIDLYMAEKIAAKGGESVHLGRVGRTLRDLATYCGEAVKMSEISLERLTEWREDRRGNTGPANANFLRVAVVGFWRWAGTHNYIGAEESALAARLPVVPISRAAREKAIRFASETEALFVLREIKPQFRMFAVLGLFAGLRPEEISPQTRSNKPGLDFGAISDEDDCIYLPASVSKVGVARLIPMSDCLRSWLIWAGWSPGRVGEVCRYNKKRTLEPKRLGELLKAEFEGHEGWPHDWLRHSYATYRNAVLRSLHQVAEEMGTSVKMMQKHYHQPQPKSVGESFFALRPEDLDRSTVIKQMFGS